MSTKTTFKRIALVAVAALGLGTVSVAPSQATISNLALGTPTAGAATFISGTSGAVSNDTTTAATITVSGLLTSAADTITVRIYENTKPTDGVNATSVKISVADTSTANTFVALPATSGSPTAAKINKYPVGPFGQNPTGGAGTNAQYDSATVGSGYDLLAGGASGAAVRGTSYGNVGATFAINLETGTIYTAGTYTYTVLATAYSWTGTSYTTTVSSAVVSIVVGASTTAAAAAAKAPAAANAVAYIGTATGPSSDAVVTAVATASTTPVAYVKVNINNTNGTAGVAEDSLTATLTGPGLICDGSVCGKSLTAIALTAGTKELTVRADGNAGVATINISSTVATLAAKTVTFYAKAAKTLTSSVRVPVLKVGANTGAVSVAATDANGIAWTGTAYIYASSAADALIAGSETPSACSYSATTGIRCDITGKLVGTAKLQLQMQLLQPQLQLQTK